MKLFTGVSISSVTYLLLLYSPENGPIVNGASYDQQFIWQHFENTIQAAETLGVDADLVAEWKENSLNWILY